MLQDCFPEKGTKFTTIGRRVAQVCISWMMVESGVTTKAFGAHTIAYVAEHIKVGNGVGGRRGQRSIRVLTLAMYLWLYVRAEGGFPFIVLGIKTGNREKNREKEGIQGISSSGGGHTLAIQLKYVDRLFFSSIIRVGTVA